MPSRPLLIDPTITNPSYEGIVGNLNHQPANMVLAGPTTGVDAVPAFRVLGASDVPAATPTAFVTLTPGTTVTWATAGVPSAKAKLTPAQSFTLVLTGVVAGQKGTLEIIQGGSGSYAITLPANSKVSGGGSGAITLSTSVGAIDVLEYDTSDGTNLLWTANLNYT
jgi:hypothetical protein